MTDGNENLITFPKAKAPERTPLALLPDRDLPGRMSYAEDLRKELVATTEAFVSKHGVGVDHAVVGIGSGEFIAIVAEVVEQAHRPCILAHLEADDPVEIASFMEAKLSRNLDPKEVDDATTHILDAVVALAKSKSLDTDVLLLGLVNAIECLTIEAEGVRRDLGRMLTEKAQPSTKVG